MLGCLKAFQVKQQVFMVESGHAAKWNQLSNSDIGFTVAMELLVAVASLPRAAPLSFRPLCS